MIYCEIWEGLFCNGELFCGCVIGNLVFVI